MGPACRRSLDSSWIWRRFRLWLTWQEPCWQEGWKPAEAHNTYSRETSEYLPPDMLYGHSHQYIPHSPSFSTLEARSIQSHARDEGWCRSKNHWTDRQRSQERSCCGNQIACRFRVRWCLCSRSGALEEQGLAGGACSLAPTLRVSSMLLMLSKRVKSGLPKVPS